MIYIIVIILLIVFFIWLFWFEYHDKNSHLKAKEEISILLNKDKPIVFNDSGSDSDKIICPNCGSTQIQLMKRGWKITTGLLNSSKIERVCIRCKHKF